MGLFCWTKAFLNLIYFSLIRVFNLVLIPKISKVGMDFKPPKDHSDGSLSMTKLLLGPFVAQQDGGEAKQASRWQARSTIVKVPTFAGAHSSAV